MSEYDESDQDNSSDGATPRPQDESTLVEIQDESMDSDVAANVEVTTGQRATGTRSWQGISKSTWSVVSL